MTTSIVPIRKEMAQHKPPFLLNLYRSGVLGRLKLLQAGEITVVEGDIMRFGDENAELKVTLTVNDARFWKEIALGGGNGAGEAYIMGWWSCSDLVGLIRILCRNRQVLSKMEGGLSLLTKPVHAFAHWLHRNSKSGAARNISAHYDLGNELLS